MVLPTTEDLKKIHQTHLEAEKDFRNRALMVIETLCGGDIVEKDITKLKSQIYQIAHSAITPKTCEHPDWCQETENLYSDFKNCGLI